MPDDCVRRQVCRQEAGFSGRPVRLGAVKATEEVLGRDNARRCRCDPRLELTTRPAVIPRRWQLLEARALAGADAHALAAPE
jgi:hypothetical protein